MLPKVSHFPEEYLDNIYPVFRPMCTHYRDLLQVTRIHSWNITIYEPQHEKTNNVVSDQVWHKPRCTATGDGWRIEILYLVKKGIVLSKERKQRHWSASRLPRSLSASLFSHMKNVGFFITRLIYFKRVIEKKSFRININESKGQTSKM